MVALCRRGLFSEENDSGEAFFFATFSSRSFQHFNKLFIGSTGVGTGSSVSSSSAFASSEQVVHYNFE